MIEQVGSCRLQESGHCTFAGARDLELTLARV